MLNYNLSAFVNTAKVSTDKSQSSNKSNFYKSIALKNKKVNLIRIYLILMVKINLRSCSVYGGFTLSYKYELYYPNTANNSPCGGFQVHVLPEHFEFCFKQDLKFLIWLVKHSMIRSFLIFIFSFSNREIKSQHIFKKKRLNQRMSTKHTLNTAYHTLNFVYHTYLLDLMML